MSRTVAVIGTGPAIGRACATSLGNDGAHVVCIDRDLAAAEATASALASASAVQADVLDRDSVRAAMAHVVDTHGGLDALVNVVGGSRWNLATDISDQDWDEVLALNLRQQWVVAQESIRVMAAQGAPGSLVMISSVSGLAAATRHGAYGAAKAGLNSLVRTLAVENAPMIRVNAVAPGSIDTPARTDDQDLGAGIPLGRRGMPHEIGAAAAFLASDAASYVTGQVLVVDGGASVKHALIEL